MLDDVSVLSVEFIVIPIVNDLKLANGRQRLLSLVQYFPQSDMHQNDAQGRFNYCTYNSVMVDRFRFALYPRVGTDILKEMLCQPCVPSTPHPLSVFRSRQIESSPEIHVWPLTYAFLSRPL